MIRFVTISRCIFAGLFLLNLLTTEGLAQTLITGHAVLNLHISQFNKAEFEIKVAAPFKNPYDVRDIGLNMVLRSPSGKSLTLPCYYESGKSGTSLWKAKFTPQESGSYRYHFQLIQGEKVVFATKSKTFKAASSGKDGFLHTNDYWTFRFDSGKPFRGIGENIGWEGRSFEKSKWTYDYLLPTLSGNGANFFRTWMCVWNLPVAWSNVHNTTRYSNDDDYFNESGIDRMDDLVALCDSLGLYFMLSIDAHGALITTGEWKYNNHNKVNGGPAAKPEEFFTQAESKMMYKNRLRYLIARWGYSPSIAAWEFFNEIDNAVFTSTPQDSALMDPAIITQWHDEMSIYLKEQDPYGHIVTTSISHRDIAGLNDLPNIDLNQKHIYNKTHRISPEIHTYTSRHGKPYVIGEFGYDWNWDNVKHERGAEFDFDYKRGLWYGMFSPTPILPMTWWWEFFDDRNMTPYFNSVSEINDLMMKAGNGSFEVVKVSAEAVEAYAVKCGKTYFVYLLNVNDEPVQASFSLPVAEDISFKVKAYDPNKREYENRHPFRPDNHKVALSFSLGKKEMTILIIEPAEIKTEAESGGR